MASLTTSITSERLRETSMRFWNWWSSELAKWLPFRWRTMISEWLRHATMEESSGTLILHCGGSSSLRIELKGTDARAEIGRYFGSERWKLFRRPVIVRIPRQAAIFRQISLPKAAIARLRSALRLQLARLSPIAPELVEFDYQVMGGNAGPDVLVEVAIVPNAVLQRYRKELDDVGLTVKCYVIDDLPYKIPTRRSISQQSAVGLFAVGLVMAGAAAELVQSSRDNELAEAVHHASSLRILAAEAARARNQTDDLISLERFLSNMRGPRPALDVLLDLTEALPPTVHLTSIAIQGGGVRISGVAPSIQQVTSPLLRTRHFSQPRSLVLSRQANGYLSFFLEATAVPNAINKSSP